MKKVTLYLDKPLPFGRLRASSVCSRLLVVLCVLAGVAACSRGEEPGTLPDEACGIGFYGSVATRAAAAAPPARYIPMTDNPYYGTVHVRHTRNGKLNIDGYADADNQLSFEANAGLLKPIKDDPATPDNNYLWYWEKRDTPHVFHAWTLPTDGTKQGDGEKIVTIDEQYPDRFGTVNLSMDKRYEFESPEQFEGEDGNKIDVNGRLSNLEYFIGAVKGPVNMADNGSTNVTLDFKHLVAKIIVADIKHRTSDGALQDVTGSVAFNMPNRAYWTTGVPADDGNYDLSEVASVAPHLLALNQTEEEEEKEKKVDFKGYSYEMGVSDYGVSGTLEKGWCFYIYPCEFDATNTEGHKMGEIEFRLDDSWYYGMLESLTGVKELQAGDCTALTLLLMDGEIRGLYPHIVDWSTDKKEVEHHDRPGIYNEDDWKKYIDWIKECDQSGESKPEPPGLFDKGGNLNLYCDLDLRNQPSQYATPDKLLFPEGGGKLAGNGHRVKTTSDWSKFKDNLTDIHVSVNGEYTEYE